MALNANAQGGFKESRGYHDNFDSEGAEISTVIDAQ